MAKNIVRAEKIEDFEILDLMPRKKTTDNREGVDFDFDFDSDFDEISNSSSNHDPDLDSDTDSVWGLESGSYFVIRKPSMKNHNINDYQGTINISSGSINARCGSLKQATKECIEAIGEECTLNKTFVSQEQIHHPCHQKCSSTFFSNISQDSRRVETFSAEWCKQPIKTQSETLNQSHSSNKVCLALIQSFKNKEFSLCKECKTVTRTPCNSVSHEIDCPLNKAPKSVLELAEPVEWKRCLSCRSEIKLKCQVGSDFCHNCALQRVLINNSDRNSNCDEELQAIGGEDKDLDPFIKEKQVEAGVIKDEWYGLRLESCLHCDWRWRKGRHQCQECFQHQPQYIFECLLCYFHVCYRCRRKKFYETFSRPVKG